MHPDSPILQVDVSVTRVNRSPSRLEINLVFLLNTNASLLTSLYQTVALPSTTTQGIIVSPVR